MGKPKNVVWRFVSSVAARIVDHWVGYLSLAIAGLLFVLLRKTWGWLLGTVTLPTWAFFMLSLLAVVGIVAIILTAVLLTQKPKADTTSGEWQGYTHDSFFGYHWYWTYLDNEIDSFWIICPECKDRVQLDYSYPTGWPLLVCRTCNKSTELSLGGVKDVRGWLANKVGQVIRQRGLGPEWLVIV